MRGSAPRLGQRRAGVRPDADALASPAARGWGRSPLPRAISASPGERGARSANRHGAVGRGPSPRADGGAEPPSGGQGVPAELPNGREDRWERRAARLPTRPAASAAQDGGFLTCRPSHASARRRSKRATSGPSSSSAASPRGGPPHPTPPPRRPQRRARTDATAKPGGAHRAAVRGVSFRSRVRLSPVVVALASAVTPRLISFPLTAHSAQRRAAQFGRPKGPAGRCTFRLPITVRPISAASAFSEALSGPPSATDAAPATRSPGSRRP
ncbi:hypothetical protein Pla111_33190 [Botrimarina hoheduenensis]|uniref:Uncharacterized protein n=1 Tax=Botrimarina hoheduenensis TaxID=2528000 RepID=A0A5C5VQ18_9BACT|nr:hypothetical protein Pla111_33190 [Botrimarina hoheduenensis]